MDSSSCDRSLLWQTLEKVTYALSNINSEREAQHVLTHIYTSLDVGISKSSSQLDYNNAIVDEKQCEMLMTGNIPTDEDELLEVISSSPDFKNVNNRTSVGSMDFKFPAIDSDGNCSERRDSGVSLRSNPSPIGMNCISSPNYSDYDNVGEGDVFPLPDVFVQSQYLPISGNSSSHTGNRRLQPVNSHRDLYRRNPNVLPAIEETELDCFDDDDEHPQDEPGYNHNNKNGDNIQSEVILKELNNSDDSFADSIILYSEKPFLNGKNVKEEEQLKNEQLIRPKSLEIVKHTASTLMYHGENDKNQNMYNLSRPRSMDSVDKEIIMNIGYRNEENSKKGVISKQLPEHKNIANTNNQKADSITTGIVTKDVKWVCVPEVKTQVPLSMWKQISEETSYKPIKVDFKKIQTDFTDKYPQSLQSASDELNLLNSDTALAINLFLARLETNPEYVSECVQEGDLTDLGVEGVRHLASVLPGEEEIRQLRKYIDDGGSIYDMAPPEQLLILLSSIPGYRLQLDATVFHSDFNDKFFRLNEAFEVLLKTCKDVVACSKLRHFMEFSVRVGNFLNKNSYIGQVHGVSLATWHRISDVTCSQSHNNLLSWIINYIGENNSNTMTFFNDIPTLEKASSYDIEEMKSEVNKLGLQLKKFLNKLTSAPHSVKIKYDTTVQTITRNLQTLQDQIQGVKFASQQLKIYLCEDEATFDIQICLKTLSDFVLLVKKIKMENEDRQIEAQLAGVKMKQMIDQQIDQYFADIFDHQEVSLSTTPKKTTNSFGLVDHLLKKLHGGEIDPNYMGIYKGSEYRPLQPHVMPEHKEDRFSPDKEIVPIIPSHSTPSKPDESLLEIPELKEIETKKTYADRADLHIKGQYRKNMQVLSSSFTDSNHENTAMKKTVKAPEFETAVQPSSSRYNNFKDMDIILMDLDTCVDKVNSEIMKLENAKKEVILPEVSQNGNQGNNDNVNQQNQDSPKTGVKFFFGLPELDARTSENVVNSQETTDAITNHEKQEKLPEFSESNDLNLPEFTEINTKNKSKPTSKLGILKRFSKAVLRQRDGNIVSSENNTNESKSVFKRSTSDPLYTNRHAVKKQDTVKTTAESKQPNVDAKIQKETHFIADDKENNHKTSHFGKFGFGTSAKDKTAISNSKQEKPKKLHKSYSYQARSNDDIGYNKGPLKKVNSLPSTSVSKNGKSAQRKKMENAKESIVNRFIDTKGPDKPESRSSKTVAGYTNVHIIKREGSVGSSNNDPKIISNITSNFTRHNALPVRDKGRIKTDAIPVEREESSQDNMLRNNGGQTVYDTTKIIVKPSYNSQPDDDRTLESTNVKYRSATMPMKKSYNKSDERNSKIGSGNVKVEGDLKESSVKKYGSLNRFGFPKKEKKSAATTSCGAERSGIPTAPTHNLQEAEKCKLKIYKKYDIS